MAAPFPRPFRFRGRFAIRFTDEAGRRVRRTFDSRADAALALAQEKARVEEVKRGLRSPAPPDKSFGEICDYWLESRAPQKRSRIHDESIIRRHLRPALGDVRLRDLGVAQVDRFVAERAHLDRKTIANHLTLLVSMLNVAVDLGWLVKAPRIRKPRVPVFTRDYRYLRNDDEVRRLLDAAAEEGDLVFALYATAVYTGLREGELAGLEWSDVDLERRLITVQRSFGGPTKADDVRYVPILDALLPMLRQWRLRCPGKHVFPNRDGRMHQPASRIFQEVLRRVLRTGGFAETPREGRKPRPHVTFHGLRHTFASHWVMKGGDLFKLQRILGHKSVQMTMRYAHLAPEAFAADYGRFGDCAAGKVAEVVPLQSRKA